MAAVAATAVNWTEAGLVPDSVIRRGIRRLLWARLADTGANEPAASTERQAAFVEMMSRSPAALVPHLANEQHYDVPASFFEVVLGEHCKYSCCYWPDGVTALTEAEEAALTITCQRAGIEDDFFALWLDRRMMYSAALFDRPGMTLEEASVAKMEHICRKLALSPGDRLLEIGTGWGGFAIHAAQNYGCHVTTTTISRQQFEYARKRVAKLGLEERISVLLDDYRDLSPGRHGRFDKLVSIEMIEAVGHRYQPRFFRKCAEMLKPDGRMLLQSITIADQRYDQPGGRSTSSSGIFFPVAA